jgi:hypothetical protein
MLGLKKEEEEEDEGYQNTPERLYETGAIIEHQHIMSFDWGNQHIMLFDWGNLFIQRCINRMTSASQF